MRSGNWIFWILLNLWKYFNYRPLAMNILGNTNEMYGDSPTVPICPSVNSMVSTRVCMWNIPPSFWKFPWCTLNIICETKGSWSTKAVHSRLILSPTNLMLFDVFKSIKPLILFFSNEQRCVQCQRCKHLLWVMPPKFERVKRKTKLLQPRKL